MIGFTERRLRCVLMGSTAALFVLAAPALAAPDDKDPKAQGEAPQETAQDNSSGLGDIVVTARKQNESLLDAPLAITALSGEALTARGVTGFQDLNDFVPGLRYENSSANRNDRGFHTITMRGMYPGDSPNRQAVTVFVDGVPIPGGAIPGLNNIEQVEVVKGPQSAYFGRSTFAGAINFITTPASLTEFHESVDASYASYGTAEMSASVEGPIVTDKLGLRVSGRYYHTDGQYKNYGYGGRLGERETKSLAVTLNAAPTDTLSLRIFATAWEDRDGPSAQAALTEQDYNCNKGGNGRTVNGLNYICGGISSAPLNRISQNIAPNGRTDLSFILSGNPVVDQNYLDSLGLRRKAFQTNGSADWKLGDYTISGSVGVNENKWGVMTDTYNRPPDGTGYYSAVSLPYDQENLSAELRLTSPSGRPIRFMLGTNYYWESIFFNGVAYRGNAISTLTQPTDYRARTVGIFGSGAIDITRGLTLSGEGRYQWDTINHVVKITNGANLKQTFKSFSPRVILNYKLDADLNLYASWSRGTRPGTFNTVLTTISDYARQQVLAQFDVPVAVKEEKLTMYEAGLKGEFLDRSLRVLLAGYYGQWRNRQINQNIAYKTSATATTTTTSTFTLSNGSTDLWGIELETTYKPTRALTLEGTFNWAHTKILNTSCTECIAIDGVLNPVGNSMERYPEFSGTAAATYETSVGGGWKGSARLDFIYTGRQYAEASNETWLNPSGRFNARIGIHDERYTIELFGRNILDNKRPTNILRNANPSANTAEGANLIILAVPERATFGIRGALRY